MKTKRFSQKTIELFGTVPYATKKSLLFITLVLSTICLQSGDANAQIIRTYAGTGVPGYSGDGGLATSAQFFLNPSGIVFDAADNLYFADKQNGRIRRIDAITGIITTVVGTGVNGWNGDGSPATSIELNNPSDLAIDVAGNLYIADYGNSRIRKVVNPGNPTLSTVSTIAGNGTSAHTGDGGPAIAAEVNSPTTIAVDPSGNIYLSSTSLDYCIRVISATTGNIDLFAGNGTPGYSGDGGAATSAQLWSCTCIKSDALGDIYFIDNYAQLIRKVDFSGTISKIAGQYYWWGYAGDGGPATSALLDNPKGLALDGIGNIYVADLQNNVIRKITQGGTISTVAGMYTADLPAPLCTAPLSSALGFPLSVAFDSHGNLYVSDALSPRILIQSNGTQLTNVDINTLCAAGYSLPAVTPTFTVTPSGGVPPYSFNWLPNTGNTTSLSSYSSAIPQISGTGVADYTLTITDNAASCPSTDSRRVKATLTTSPTYDLAMRDSYYDMYDEPNTQATVTGYLQVWESPDLWNRILPDGVTSHQVPCSGSCTDYMFTTIRNVGCRPSPASSLYLYWTAAGVESWPIDWDGTYPYLGITGNPPQGNVVPGMPMTISPLNPGSKQQYNHSWTPPNPLAYVGSTSMEMCILARIEDHHNPSDAPVGMTYHEGSGISANVHNNNNIVSRNTGVIRVTNYSPRRSHFIVGNSEIIGRAYSLQFINDNPTQSTLNQFVHVTVSLGNVFNSWLQGGALGTYASIDYQNQTVTFDGTNTMQLDNVLFNAGEEDDVVLSFTMNSNVTGTQMQDEKVHFRELYIDPVSNNVEVYANYTYLVSYDGPGDAAQGGDGGNNGGPQARKAQTGNNPVTGIANNIKVYPNPASTTLNFEFPLSGNISIKLMDITGRILENQIIHNANKASLDVSGFVPGIYMYQINNDGNVQTGKINIGE